MTSLVSSLSDTGVTNAPLSVFSRVIFTLFIVIKSDRSVFANMQSVLWACWAPSCRARWHRNSDTRSLSLCRHPRDRLVFSLTRDGS